MDFAESKFEIQIDLKIFFTKPYLHRYERTTLPFTRNNNNKTLLLQLQQHGPISFTGSFILRPNLHLSPVSPLSLSAKP